jgi:tetratricopeptide (TPR) repeat protein
LTSVAGVVAVCAAARALEEGGRYREAAEAMADYWPGPGYQPRFEGSSLERAHVYLRAGSLTGWLGKVQGLAGFQEEAKDLLGRARSLFEAAGDGEGAAEATVAMAVAYWREGSFEEARALLDSVVDAGAVAGRRGTLNALLARAMVERSVGRYSDAADVLRQVEPLLTPDDSPVTHGTFHNGRAATYHYLAVATGLTDFLERAEQEYMATSYYAELAGNGYLHGVVENNLCLVYHLQGKPRAAHEHAVKSIGLFEAACNGRAAATPYESRARVYTSEGNLAAGEHCASEAVARLETGDESALLAEALVTRGVARARLGKMEHARDDFDRAVEVASRVGDDAGAGRAHLALIEELLPSLTDAEAQTSYDEADRLLANVQDASVGTRLRSVAGKLLRAARGRLAAQDTYSWDGFSFPLAERGFRELWVERALRDANSVRLQAARLLGIKHQSLFHILNREFPHLREKYLGKRRGQTAFNTARKRTARVVQTRSTGCCRAEPTSFERLPLKDGDDTLAARGPLGGDSLVVSLSEDARPGDLVVVREGGRVHYGYYRPGVDGFTLDFGSDDLETITFKRKEPDALVVWLVVGYAPKGSPLTILPLIPR